MQNLQKAKPVLLILLLVMICDAEFTAFSGTGKNAGCIAEAAGKLGDEYGLHFIPLTRCGTERFTSGAIGFAETEGTFLITLFSQNDPDGVVYADCPYEVYGRLQFPPQPVFIGL